MYLLAGLVLAGVLLNTMIRPLAAKYFMSDAELALEKKLAHERDISAMTGTRVGTSNGSGATSPFVTAFAWLAVGIPLMFGLWVTLQKASVLFK
jgi:hypothetical protein